MTSTIGTSLTRWSNSARVRYQVTPGCDFRAFAEYDVIVDPATGETDG
ncbi:MAG: hypothetical protein WD532_03320 [Acidimicrobiia bacterium]